MRHLLVLVLIFCPLCARAAENLMENIRVHGNVTITDGVMTQINADPRPEIQWKMQAIYSNDKHMYFGPGFSYGPLWDFWNSETGWISRTFVMRDDLTDLKYFRFGLNGDERDTTIYFDIKDVVPGATYTIQWRVLNNTQGSISWTDMRLVHCGAGYELALGDNNCSAPCENRAATGGHIPPDAARVYEPDACTYNESNLVCDDGYSRIGTVCEQHCTAGMSRLRFGNKSNTLYARKIGSPALCVQYNDRVCYGRLAVGRNPGLNVELNGTVYHLID